MPGSISVDKAATVEERNYGADQMNNIYSAKNSDGVYKAVKKPAQKKTEVVSVDI